MQFQGHLRISRKIVKKKLSRATFTPLSGHSMGQFDWTCDARGGTAGYQILWLLNSSVRGRVSSWRTRFWTPPIVNSEVFTPKILLFSSYFMQIDIFAWSTKMKTIIFWSICIKYLDENNNILVWTPPN